MQAAFTLVPENTSKRAPVCSPNGSFVAGQSGNPGGRPTRYRTEFCESVIAYMGQGFSLAAFAGSIGVAVDTAYGWTQTIPEFCEAAAIARAARVLKLETDLLDAKTMVEVKRTITMLKRAAPSEYGNRAMTRRS